MAQAAPQQAQTTKQPPAAGQAPAAEQKKEPTTMEKVHAWIDNNRANQPGFLAEMGAARRGGTEDLWKAIVPAFPESMQATREPGSPGSPTPQIVTEALQGREVDAKSDTLKAKAAPAQETAGIHGQEQQAQTGIHGQQQPQAGIHGQEAQSKQPEFGQMSRDELLAYAKEHAAAAEQKMDGHQHGHEQEHGHSM